MVLESKTKIVYKIYRWMLDKKAMRKAHFSFRLLWARILYLILRKNEKKSFVRKIAHGMKNYSFPSSYPLIWFHAKSMYINIFFFHFASFSLHICIRKRNSLIKSNFLIYPVNSSLWLERCPWLKSVHFIAVR